MSRIFKSLRLQVEKTLGNLKPRLPIASDGEIRCSTLHCRGRIKGRDMPVGWFNTAGAAPFTSPGTVRSPWVEVAPGSRSLRGRTRVDASWPPLRRNTLGIGGDSNPLASPCCWARCDAGPALRPPCLQLGLVRLQPPTRQIALLNP
jgi:hypothetical protein